VPILTFSLRGACQYFGLVDAHLEEREVRVFQAAREPAPELGGPQGTHLLQVAPSRSSSTVSSGRLRSDPSTSIVVSIPVLICRTSAASRARCLRFCF
jgi:hypothetical protein